MFLNQKKKITKKLYKKVKTNTEYYFTNVF